MNKQNKGITLIALVITIVILVILVGVSVAVTINTGLIANSKKAVADYDTAQKDEETKIQTVYDIMESMNPDSLAAKVKVGDYVTYKPKAGSYTSKTGDYAGAVSDPNVSLYELAATIDENGEETASGTQGNGYGDQTFTVPADTSAIKWRVLSIENGKVNLVSEKEIGRNGLWTGDWDNDVLYLKGITGYAYGEEEINTICSLYGTGDEAESARNINIKDLNKLTGFDLLEDQAYNVWQGELNGWADGYRWKYSSYDYWSYTDGLKTADENSTEYSLLFTGVLEDDQCYWLESNFCDSAINMVRFALGCVCSGEVYEQPLYQCSQTGEAKEFNDSVGYALRPVVTLKSTVKAKSSSTDANGNVTWEIELPTQS